MINLYPVIDAPIYGEEAFSRDVRHPKTRNIKRQIFDGTIGSQDEWRVD